MTALSTKPKSRGKPPTKSLASPVAKKPTKPTGLRQTLSHQANGEVLTLSEAAVYLRVSSDAVLELAQAGNLPGRQLGQEWRFFKTALQLWLSRASSTIGPIDFWETQAGALKDDPDLEAMLQQIYAARGRPMSENV